MRDPVQSLLTALEREVGGIAVVWCPDFGLREWLVGEVESIAQAGADPVRVSTVEEALVHPGKMALLIPNDERQVVLDMDGSRERVISEPERSQPIVVFLLRDGDGRRTLAEDAISLSSWIQGSDVDPESIAQIDVEAERDAFMHDVGRTPEQWLVAWRDGQYAHTSENFRTAYRAMLLEMS